MKIGFIGLGIMGKPMVRNLLKAGHEVTVFDLRQENIDAVTKDGAKAGKSIADVAAGVPVVITMLPNSPHVKSVVLGEDGVLVGAKPGTLLIDMSSIAPAASQEIGAACADKQVKMLDAPVSGGEPKAIDGTMAIMVGGEKELYDQYKSVLLNMGGSAVLNNAIETGHNVGAPLPLTVGVQEMFEILHADGFGSDDHSALARYYAKVSGTKIGK